MNTLVKNIKATAAYLLPRNLFEGSRVVQLFINDAGIETEYTFSNIASLFAPAVGRPYIYTVSLFDERGRFVASQDVTVPVHGTQVVKPTSLFPDRCPKLGMVSVSLRSDAALFYKDKHLGRIHPHFYALYHSPELRSYGLIHPQAGLGAEAQQSAIWRSSQLIDPSTVKSLRIFQINPCDTVCSTTLELLDQAGNVLQKAAATLESRASRSVDWSLDAYRGGGFLHVGMRGMPGANSKPLVFNFFADGSFSASHG